MIIRKLGIKGFGKFTDREIHLIDGLNIIYGENEAGKTTIQWFIKGMLFGLEGGREKDGVKPSIKRFKPWKENRYGGMIEYALDDGSIYIVNRDFNNNTVKIADNFFNDITETFEIGKDKNVKFAEKHLGINESLFERTVLIKQMKTRLDLDGKQEIINKLINIRETGFEDTSFKIAEKALSYAIMTNVGTDKTTTKPIDKIVAKLNNLKETLEELKKKRENLYEVENYINENTKQVSKLKEKIDHLHIEEDAIKQAKDLLHSINTYFQLADIKNKIEMLEQEALDLEERINKYEINVKNENYNQNNTNEMIDKAIDLVEKINNLTQEISNSKEKNNVIKNEIKHLNYVKRSLKISIVSFLIIAASILIFLIKHMSASGFSINIPIILVLISSLLIAIRLCVKHQKVIKKSLVIKNQNDELNKCMDKLSEEYDLKTAELGKINLNYGTCSIKDLIDTKVALENEKARALEIKLIKKNYDDIIRNINFLLEKASLLIDFTLNNSYKLEKEIESVKTNIEDKKARLSVIAEKMRDNSDYKLLEALDFLLDDNLILNVLNKDEGKGKDMDKFKDKDENKNINVKYIDLFLNESERKVRALIEEARDEELSLAIKLKEKETILNALSCDDDKMQRTIEDIEELEAKKRELEEIRFSLNRALEVLREAGFEMQKDFMPELNEKMSYYLSKITDGRYKDIRMDGSLLLKVISSEKEDIVNIQDLSDGTIDQIYFSLRLAMIDLISYKKEKLPLIMDEVFAQFDDKRTKEAVNILNRLSEDRQVIMFTCKKREVDIISEECGRLNLIML